MRLVADYVFVICMILIRCDGVVIVMILWLLWRMLQLLIVVFIVRSVMMFSLLFSFIIVTAAAVIKMGMIMSLLPLHWTAIRWAFVYWVIVGAIHHWMGIKRSEAGIMKRRWGGLLWIGAVGEGIVAVAQSVKRTGNETYSAKCFAFDLSLSIMSREMKRENLEHTLSWISDVDMARIPNRCAHC